MFNIINSKEMSRLKKKLLLYFILISVVSISVSAEIILEMSSQKFRGDIQKNFYSAIEKDLPARTLDKIKAKVNQEKVFEPISSLRNRMILLLIVVSVSIIGAFFLFTKDIVSPMDGIVEATKRIARGDLTVTVPVLTEDEIGQIAGLINDMNRNLQDMIFQIRQELARYKEKIEIVSHKIEKNMLDESTGEIIENRKMKVSDFKLMINMGKEVVTLLEIMNNDLTSLETFISMYKTYKMQSEISQNEIEEALKNFTGSVK